MKSPGNVDVEDLSAAVRQQDEARGPAGPQREYAARHLTLILERSAGSDAITPDAEVADLDAVVGRCP